jgi:hypothetical protein
MSIGEKAYLALVIGSWAAFALTLAWALYLHDPAAMREKPLGDEEPATAVNDRLAHPSLQVATRPF